MKRQIEKFLIILNSLIGLIFIGSVIISKIPLLHFNILDKYLTFNFLKGWLLITAYILGGLYLILSLILIFSGTKFTNNSIYVYGDGSVKVTSHNIKKIAKAIINETEGVKSSKIDIELGEFGNCLTVYLKIEDGYDFQSLVAKLRPKLEDGITKFLSIKFPSYKFADGKVLYEFGAPYAGVGIDLDNPYQKAQKPSLESELNQTLEKVYEEPYNNSAKKVIGEDVYPEVDFVPEKLDVIEEKAIAAEESRLEPEQFSIPYAAPVRKMGVKTETPFEAKAASGSSASNYKPFEQEISEQPKQAPFQAAYENINREIRQTATASNPYEAKGTDKAAAQTHISRQAQPNVQTARPVQHVQQPIQQPVQQSVQGYDQARVSQQVSQPPFRRTYPQRPIGVRPAPQSSTAAINQTQPQAAQTSRPAQRPAGTSRISKEDIYARINAILNKYSNLDDENNK